MKLLTLLLAGSACAHAGWFSNAYAVAAADFNHDGATDLVVANYLSGSLTVLLGAGDGTFPTASRIAFVGTPTAVTTGDWNGDGNADIIAANQGRAVVIPGNGDGAFGSPIVMAGAIGPSAVALADLNGDGKPDLVVNSPAPILSVFLNGVDGPPRMLSLPGGGGPPTQTLTVADINRDGKPDLLVTNQYLNVVTILRGRGDGTFDAPITVSTGNDAPTSLGVGDFNGDGNPDLVISRAGSGFALIPGRGNGVFDPPTNFSFQIPSQAVLVGDLNKDGKSDVALLLRSPLSIQVAVLLGTGSSTPGPQAWQVPSLVDLPGHDARAILSADLNGDGVPDLVVTNGLDNAITILLGNGDGTFGAPAVITGELEAAEPPTGMVAVAGMTGGSVAIDLDRKKQFAALAGDISFSSQVVVSADGERIYANTAGYITVADRRMNPIAAMPLPGLPPQALVLSPDGSRLYSVAANFVSVYDTSATTLTKTLPLGPGRGTGVISPDGVFLFVSIGDFISVIDTATGTLARTITDEHAVGLALSPDGRKLYVGNRLDSAQGICDIPDAVLIQAFDTMTGEHLGQASPGGTSCLQSLVVSPDGATIYGADLNTIRVLDSETLRQTDSLPISAHGIALTPDGSALIASTFNGLAIIDTATRKVTDTINLGFPLGQIALQRAQ